MVRSAARRQPGPAHGCPPSTLPAHPARQQAAPSGATAAEAPCERDVGRGPSPGSSPRSPPGPAAAELGGDKTSPLPVPQFPFGSKTPSISSATALQRREKQVTATNGRSRDRNGTRTKGYTELPQPNGGKNRPGRNAGAPYVNIGKTTEPPETKTTAARSESFRQKGKAKTLHGRQTRFGTKPRAAGE